MKIERDIEGPAYQNGREIVDAQGCALVPVCPGNGHFTAKNVEDIMRVVTDYFSRIVVFVPDKPTQHTYKAIGYNEKEAQQMARKQGNQMFNKASKAFKKLSLSKEKYSILRWSDISTSPEYLAQLNSLNVLYEKNETFADQIRSETRRVVQRRLEAGSNAEASIETGTPYIREELAFCSASPKMLKVDRLAYVYHKEWMLDKYISGELDGEPKSNLGMVIIR